MSSDRYKPPQRRSEALSAPLSPSVRPWSSTPLLTNNHPDLAVYIHNWRLYSGNKSLCLVCKQIILPFDSLPYPTYAPVTDTLTAKISYACARPGQVVYQPPPIQTQIAIEYPVRYNSEGFHPYVFASDEATQELIDAAFHTKYLLKNI